MAATRQDIDRWIKTAKEKKDEYIISVCDTWDYDDYPVYCKDLESLKKSYSLYNGENMQSVNEIIRIKNGVVTENLNIRQITL